MPEENEFMPVMMKLLERTMAGRVEWKGTFESTTFICSLQGEYSFEIVARVDLGGDPLSYRLTMTDKNQQAVFIVDACTPSGDTSSENDRLYEVLAALYERARRAALDVDKKVKDVADILDRL